MERSADFIGARVVEIKAPRFRAEKRSEREDASENSVGPARYIARSKRGSFLLMAINIFIDPSRIASFCRTCYSRQLVSRFVCLTTWLSTTGNLCFLLNTCPDCEIAQEDPTLALTNVLSGKVSELRSNLSNLFAPGKK